MDRIGATGWPTGAARPPEVRRGWGLVPEAEGLLHLHVAPAADVVGERVEVDGRRVRAPVGHVHARAVVLGRVGREVVRGRVGAAGLSRDALALLVGGHDLVHQLWGAVLLGELHVEARAYADRYQVALVTLALGRLEDGALRFDVDDRCKMLRLIRLLTFCMCFLLSVSFLSLHDRLFEK